MVRTVVSLCRKIRFLPESQSFLAPINHRGDKKIHINAFVIVIINSFSIFSMVFKAAAHTTPKRVFLSYYTPYANPKARAGNMSPYRFEDLAVPNMVIKSTFIIIRNSSIGCPAEQMTGQLQHIIGTTRFPGIT